MANRFRQMLRPPRKLIFTGDGRWFVGVTIFLGAGAVNTGNNLLYLLLGMLLGLIIVSGILSERMLRGLQVSRLPTGEIFAGRPARVAFEIRNTKTLFSSFSIFVREHEARETRAWRRTALGLPPEPPRKRKAREAENDPGPPAALAIRIPAGGAVVATGEATFPRRGLYSYVGVDVGTRFPFGFFEKLRPVTMPAEVLVYPAVREPRRELLGEASRWGEVNRADPGHGGDFLSLQEYRVGDDIRDVHWKVSARRGVLVRKIYEKEDNESIALHLYNWVPDGLDEAALREAEDALEEAIVETASAAGALVREGRRFSLNTIGEHVVDGAGAGHLKVVLRHLALLRTERGEPPALELSRTPNRVLFAPAHAPAGVVGRFERTLTSAGADRDAGSTRDAA